MINTSTIITVSQLTFSIKNQLESRFTHLTVEGEISNAKLHSSGHFYFDLKDAHAKVGAVMFRAQYSQLPHPPKEGDLIIVKGALSVYPPHGKYQILVRKLEYRGVGELLLKLERLKKKLKAQGWFDREKKKKLPRFPRSIGIITSPTGAVIRDMIQVLTRRYGNFHLILNPVRVQGAEAHKEIAQAIDQFNHFKLVDVLIVGRGGGSFEDLWPFNEESVAKAIFESDIPIVSAVGHESDVTIADFVADVRAPTPSAAAELITAEKVQHLQYLAKTGQQIFHLLSHLIKRYHTELNSYKRHPLFATSYGLLAQPMQRLDEIKMHLDNSIKQAILKQRYHLDVKKKEALSLQPTTLLIHFRERLNRLSKNLEQSHEHLLTIKRHQLKEVIKELGALDPKNVLKRGYSILFSLNEGSAIVSVQQLRHQKKIRALLSDGEALLKVDDD